VCVVVRTLGIVANLAEESLLLLLVVVGVGVLKGHGCCFRYILFLSKKAFQFFLLSIIKILIIKMWKKIKIKIKSLLN